MSNSEIIIILTAIGIGCFAVLLAIRLMRFARETRQLRTQLAEQAQQHAHDAEVFEQGKLRQQISELTRLVDSFRTDTQNWATAFTFKPIVQGKWGEIQVENSLQFAGMKKPQDYDTQVRIGKIIADFVVKLPDLRKFVIDSKVTVESVLKFHNATTDVDRKLHLDDIVRRVRAHANGLVPATQNFGHHAVADFVVMCVPDYPLQLAIEHEQGLIDEFGKQQVIICGQSALLALIKTVAMGWRGIKLSESAEEIRDLGKDLYDRLANVRERLAEAAKGLQSAVKAFNTCAGSFNHYLVPQARRFKENGIQSPKEIDDVPRVNT